MLIAAGKQVLDSKIAVLGLTFKENVPDLRNTRIVDIISELKDYGVEVLVHDPMADEIEAKNILRYFFALDRTSWRCRRGHCNGFAPFFTMSWVCPPF